jgi:nucleotide-binding universal stress UspA family protein
MVPLDGTLFAESAISTAAELARAASGRLLLAHVNVPLPPVAVAEGVLPPDPVSLPEVEASARRYLETVTGRVAEHAGVSVESAFVTGDTPQDALRDLAVDRGADLIVMASHRRGGFEQLLLGSTGERVARAPGVPVLLLRTRDDAATPEADPIGAPAYTLRHILVPLDGSAVAEAALEPATRLARARGAAFTLLTVRDPLLAAAELPQHSLGVEYLERVASRLRADGFAVAVRDTEDRNAGHAITHCAVEVGADVIAMSTHGRGGLARLVAGSVAHKVLHDALVPVLLVRPLADDDRDSGELGTPSSRGRVDSR